VAILGSGSHTTDVTCCITTGACTSMSQENVWQGCTNMACEHMKGVAMAHDVTKQVTIENKCQWCSCCYNNQQRTVKLKHKF
jgi:hypothetical protein